MAVLPRVRAPELVGRGWLNSDRPTVRLADLRGRFVLLDFWTFCCVNCLHVIDELRPLEREWGEQLVVIGVHSPKFVHEADPAALAAAVERYGVDHLVLDDPTLRTWDAYTARAWPTLVLLDPDGYVVAQYAGEGHVHAVDALMRSLRDGYDLATGPLGLVNVGRHGHGALSFPASAVELANGSLLVTDTGSHRLVELIEPSSAAPARVIGSGTRGRDDGPPTHASFAEPNGLCVLPTEVAAAAGYDVVVADSANHLLRGVRLRDGHVTSVAGAGEPWMPTPGRVPGLDEQDVSRLSSPWDVAWWRDRVWIAMAGIHQLWTFDPQTGEVAAVAGTRNEGLVDGVLADAWFAQPSGLAVSLDGTRLYVADAETSAVRVVHERDGDLVVETLVGQGLFDFGLRDGPAADALLQHPLGVTALPDGAVAVHDTYNGAIRRLGEDDSGWSVSTLITGLAEPSGGVVMGDRLIVVESAAHRLTAVRWQGASAVTTELPAARTLTRVPTDLAGGAVVLSVTFTPPPGQELDTSAGPATELQVSATPARLLVSGAGTSADLERALVIDPGVVDGVLHVSARAASCDLDAEHPVCHLHQQDWGVPIRVIPNAPDRLSLILAG